MNPIKGIVQFNVDRNLSHFKGASEYAMITEELGEFVMAHAVDNEQEMVDALCDIIVLCTGAIHKLGFDPELALTETVKEISSRNGQINTFTGKWEKDLNQDPLTLYKAEYNNARY